MFRLRISLYGNGGIKPVPPFSCSLLADEGCIFRGIEDLFAPSLPAPILMSMAHTDDQHAIVFDCVKDDMRAEGMHAAPRQGSFEPIL